MVVDAAALIARLARMHDEAARRRAALLQERRQRMSSKVLHAQMVAARCRLAAREAATSRRARIELDLERAARKRSEQRQTQLHLLAHRQPAALMVQHVRTPLHAASVIQQWWRVHRKIARTLPAFRSAGLSCTQMSIETFEAATARMRRAQVVRVTDELLRSLWPAQPLTSWSTRAFISAYLFVTHGSEVLTGFDASLDESVVSASRLMLGILSLLCATGGRTRIRASLMEAFRAACSSYFVRFDAWRKRDADFMLKRVQAHYTELEAFRAQMLARPPDGPPLVIDAEVYLQQTEQEQRRLLSQMARLTSLEDATQFAERVSGSQRAGLLLDGMDRPRRPSRASDHPSEQPNTPHEQHQGKQNRMNALLNEHIAHELVLDENFRLEDDEAGNTLTGEVQAQARRAFWSLFVASVSEGDASMVPALVQDVAGQLLQLAPTSRDVASSVAAQLGVERITEEIARNAFDARATLTFIADLLARLCAPARDANVAALRATIAAMPRAPQAADLVTAFEEVMQLLRLCRLDLANFHLLQLRPVLLPRAIAFEREKFQAHLERGDWDLSRTRAWLAQHGGNVMSGLAALLVEDSATTAALPETLYLDAARIARSAHALRRIVVVSIICMAARTARVLASNDIETRRRVCERALDAWREDDNTLDGAIAAFVGALSPKMPSHEAIERLWQHARKAALPSSAVTTVVQRSLRKIVADMLAGQSPASDTYLGAGLTPVRARLDSVLVPLARFAAHHCSVHADIYAM